MKVSVTFFLLCALVGINQAHFETIYGEIENHEYIGNKTAQIAGDSGTALVSKKFTFPSIGEPRTHVITGFKKVDETDYIPKFKIESGGIGFNEIVANITSDYMNPILYTTFYFYGDKL